MNCKRLSIAYSVNKLGRFISNLSKDYCITIKKDTQIFEVYLRLWATLYWLPSMVLERYNDANWISNTKN